MARGGATMFEIAQALGVGMSSLHRWAAIHEDFRKVLYCEGHDAFDDRLERTLAERASGYSYETEKVFSNGERVKVIEHIPPDMGAIKMWLGTRRRNKWADQPQDVNITAHVTTDTDERSLAMATVAMLRAVAERQTTIEHEPAEEARTEASDDESYPTTTERDDDFTGA